MIGAHRVGPDVTKRARVRAAELVGRGWLNTGGKSYSLKDFRGKVLLLDFWTFCCVNCLHVLDELRPLEAELADVLVTVGVHSPKFEHEADPVALADAVERYDVHHPVLDDPDLTTWQAYAVRAWPTLVVVDPEGYVVHVAAGEGHAEALRRVIADVVSEHDRKGTLHRGDGPYVPPPAADTVLRFPGKVTVTPAGTLLVANTARHNLVEFAADGETVLRTIDSDFREPGGLAVLPASVADQVGYDVVVADTVNHLLRGVRLADGVVSTVAGTGQQWRDGETDGPATKIDLTSPWDVAWWEPAGGLVIAMAGNHTLSVFDPVAGMVRRFAGTTVEGLHDGPADQAFFAQPSGLAADGDRLWLVDAETSALRWLSPDLVVHTAIGTGLFDFGHRDGPAEQALLQHPLGLAVLPDHSVAVADTYNGAIRRYDPATDEVTTLATGLAEPSGAVVVGADLVVVESAAHRLVRPVPVSTTVAGDPLSTQRPRSDVAARTTLTVTFEPPPGRKLDERYGPATRLSISASPPELLRDGAGDSTELTRAIELGTGEGVLHITAQAAACDDDPAIEHPACHVARQDWGVPIRVTDNGRADLRLVLLGE